MLAAEGFYTHDVAQGLIVVAVVCGAMVVFAAWVAYMNFGPGAKNREGEN